MKTDQYALWPRRLVLGSLASVAAAAALFAEAEPTPPAVVRIEEDWRLVLNEPDDGVDSPQFHTTMSPTDNTDDHYAVVLWNYREVHEDFVPGGVQLQSAYQDEILRTRNVESRQLSTSAETITWTQALQTDGALLSFEIFNGESGTWGTFGRDMRIDEDANLTDLSGYDTNVSAENACITYGSNRVNRLEIIQVRRYGPGGELLSVDDTTHVVFDIDENTYGE